MPQREISDRTLACLGGGFISSRDTSRPRNEVWTVKAANGKTASAYTLNGALFKLVRRCTL